MTQAWAERIEGMDWTAIGQSLEEEGFAKLPALLDQEQCSRIIGLYGQEACFRSTIDMARYRFGQGEYKYFASPLPEELQILREGLYPGLARTANGLREKLGQGPEYPAALGDFLERCHQQGQARPTPLILKYEQGGYNCLHQDLYGEVYFPFQAVFLLNQQGEDFTGGEFLLVEQRPRAQSRGHVITLNQGEGLIFPTRERPVRGTRGYYRAALRHGVGTIASGTRYSLGIVFHDAK
ncbi:2OG-Fe(II) oxygenase [Paenibacillus sp. S-38]|uniref:2OG-Fe(II) oxygenase n=1 Tax=Paenibacillus sp. S-38 TaxID=3416710 RepID=UPI003CF5A1A6